MGYMFVIAPCYCCGGIFSMNPSLVPSVPVDGERFPVCRPCIEGINRIREGKGIAQFPILPGAYDPEECQ